MYDQPMGGRRLLWLYNLINSQAVSATGIIMDAKHLLFLALLVGFPGLSIGGEHRPLCEKAQASSLIVEVEFLVKGQYPESMRKRGWGPPEKVLAKIRRTGRVTQVLKGDIKLGDPWNPRWDTSFAIGGASVAAWDRFFRRKTFRYVFFLEKPAVDGGSWQPAGYAEASAPCGSEESNHRSWCAQYAEYKAAVKRCLDPPASEPAPVIP